MGDPGCSFQCVEGEGQDVGLGGEGRVPKEGRVLADCRSVLLTCGSKVWVQVVADFDSWSHWEILVLNLVTE